jgi:hypothetical protein
MASLQKMGSVDKQYIMSPYSLLLGIEPLVLANHPQRLLTIHPASLALFLKVSPGS